MFDGPGVIIRRGGGRSSPIGWFMAASICGELETCGFTGGPGGLASAGWVPLAPLVCALPARLVNFQYGVPEVPWGQASGWNSPDPNCVPQHRDTRPSISRSE